MPLPLTITTITIAASSTTPRCRHPCQGATALAAHALRAQDFGNDDFAIRTSSSHSSDQEIIRAQNLLGGPLLVADGTGSARVEG